MRREEKEHVIHKNNLRVKYGFPCKRIIATTSQIRELRKRFLKLQATITPHAKR